MLNRSMLIVEGDRELLDMLCRRFIRGGFDVTPVHHPRQALQAASFKDFQVAVLDVSLPETNGVALMQKLKRQIADLKVVLLSPHSDPAFEAEALEHGADAYFVKPCRLSELEATIELAIHRQPEQVQVSAACSYAS